jgi:hypothetical protein
LDSTCSKALVEFVHLEDVLADNEVELLLDRRRKMQGDVPFLADHAVARLLFYSTIVEEVLEKEDAPVLGWHQVNVGEQGVLLDSVEYKLDKVICLIEACPLGMDDNLVEARIDDLATEELEALEQHEEVLLH